MSQGSSDPLFDSADFGAPLDDFGSAETANLPGSVPVPTKAVASNQVHGFTIYTVLLYISFVLLTIASILFFMDAGKY
ncbi:MAG: hypothetical protein ACK52A_08540 [Planctomycetota bacterium]